MRFSVLICDVDAQEKEKEQIIDYGRTEYR